MPSMKALVATALCLSISLSAQAQDKKKQMVVAAGQAAQQVNNHYWTYTTPGQANTNCSGSGTVNATATSTGSNTAYISGTVDTSNNCNTTYTPPQTTVNNRVTVDNAAWVTDVATGDQYLIQCTANWQGSKCSYLNSGRYKAELDGNNMKVTGMKGMKEMTAKYHVLRYIPTTKAPQSYTQASAPVRAGSSWTADETYGWETYKAAGPEDKDYVRVFCSATPRGAALLPRAKVASGQGPEHALDCAAWISAKSKAE